MYAIFKGIMIGLNILNASRDMENGQWELF